MAYKEIKTSISINATAAQVWSVLTDFENYKHWNPFLLSVEGDVAVGNRIAINAGGMKFKPIVLVLEQNVVLRWIGKFLFKGLFDGEHSFRIQAAPDGTVTFYHEEAFKGLLVSLFANKLDYETREGFEAMNKKLKELVEAKYSTASGDLTAL